MPQLFISSTFSDMNDERDMIRNSIIPLVNKKIIKKYGLFDAVDLRWGINTSDMDEKAANKKVVEICLDRIYQCIPFFIVLIGDRYGYSIEEHDYQKSIVLENHRKKLEPSFKARGKKSITELEIEYGSFLSKYKNGYCLFYVRDIVNKANVPDYFFASTDEDKEKVRLLREKAINEYNAKIYHATYENGKMVSNELQDLIVDDLTAIVEKELSKGGLSQLTGIHNLEKEASRCYGREKEISKIHDFLKSGVKDKLLVTGPSGVGKSATIAKALNEVKNDYDILPFYVKLSQKNDLLSYLREINNGLYPIYAGLIPPLVNRFGVRIYNILDKDGLYRCSKQRCEDNDDIHIEIETFNLLISAISRFAHKKTVIYLDGIDELDSNQLVKSLSFITLLHGEEEKEFSITTNLTNGDFLGDNLKIIISSSDLLNYDRSKLDILNFSLLDIKNIEKDNLEAVIDNLFVKLYKKEKPFQKLLSAIVEKTNEKNCLYLSVAMHHLLYLGRDDFAKIAIGELDNKDFRNNYFVETIENIKDDCEIAIVDLLSDVCRKANVSINVFAAIAICKDGLTKKELYDLNIGFNELDYQYVDFILDDFFIVDERLRIKFAHQQIRKAILKHLVTKKHREMMMDYLVKNKASHFYSYLENKILLERSSNKFIGQLIRNKEVLSYESLFNVLKNTNLIAEETISASIIENILQYDVFISEDDFISILSHKKYQTIKVALAYLRLYYVRNKKIQECIKDIISNAKKSDLKTLAILYTNPIVHSYNIDFKDESKHSLLIKSLVETRRLYDKFQNMELDGKKEIYSLADKIAKIKTANALDMLMLRQEYCILLYEALNDFENDFNVIDEYQNELLNKVIHSTGNRIIIENYIFCLNDIDHYLSQMIRFGSDNNFYYFMTYGNEIVKKSNIGYLCDYTRLFNFYKNAAWKPYRNDKKIDEDKIPTDSFITDIEDKRVAIHAAISLSSSIKDKKTKNYLTRSLLPYATRLQKTYYEIEIHKEAPYPDYFLKEVEERIKNNSPYFPGSDFSIYKDHFEYRRKNKPLEHYEHLAFLSILFQSRLRQVRAFDIYKNNNELSEIYRGIVIVSKTKKNKLISLAQANPFIRAYQVENYPVKKLMEENPKNVDDLARLARVIQYRAEDMEGMAKLLQDKSDDLEGWGDPNLVFDLYYDAINKYFKCMKMNHNEVSYRHYALSCARKANRLLHLVEGINHELLFLTEWELVLKKSKIFEIELSDRYAQKLHDASLICQFFNRYVLYAILFPIKGFLESVVSSFSIIMNEPNYTKSKIFENDKDFADNIYAYEFLNILLLEGDKTFARKMRHYLAVYSKKTVKPIDRKVFIEKNNNNFGYRKMYCKYAKHAIDIVKNDRNVLKDRAILLGQLRDAVLLEEKNKGKQ